MKTKAFLGAAGLASVVIVLGQLNVEAVPGSATDPGEGGVFQPIGGGIGPDVIVCQLPSTVKWATSGTETSYSIATTSANIGDENLDWVASPSVRHPVISQNMYRYRDGVMEHIGQSWLKHSFCALQLTGCGPCAGGGGCLSFLRPGCRDPYSASRNGSQGGLGPKWQVNAHTGQFSVPWDQGAGTSGDFNRRLRVNNVDLDPDLNPGAKYFVSSMYVALDDAAANNRHNNASYRQVTVNPTTFNLAMSGSTVTETAAIEAWDDFVPSVVLQDVFVAEENVDGSMTDARYIVANNVTDNGDGTWDYEYAVYNMNSHRSVGAFSVPMAPGVNVTDIEFHDVNYHSGEAWDSTDWAVQVGADAITWQTEPYSDNEQANALRWDTMYNFRFTADTPPADATATMSLFRPGASADPTVVVSAPSAGEPCGGDFDGDGSVGFTDLVSLLSAWGPCVGCPQDLDGSGDVGFADLVSLLSAWNGCIGG
ncbi:MAG: hypothetical protein HKO59_01760 [Phycisphaerales bacterium]|nr:hypothetical protein [Phycisphaerae bacterium]NNM24708.1 hypothetical protein [Phycisphaerales bacterium]